MEVVLSTDKDTSNLIGTVVVTATVTPAGHATPLTDCKFYVGSGTPTQWVLKATDTSYPLTFSWDTTTVADGDYSLRAVVVAKQTKTSSPLPVKVKNASMQPPPPLDPPVNLTAPTISGTAQVGQLLTVNVGTWANQPTSYSKQWLRCDAAGANPVPIPAATGQTYSLVTADQGSTIRCAVIARNSAGDSPAINTAQTGVVAAAAGTVPTANFTWSPANPVVGETVTFTPTTNGTICYWDRTADHVPEATLAPGTPFTFAYTGPGTKTVGLQTESAGGIKSSWVDKTLVVSESTPPEPTNAYFYWAGNTLPGPWTSAEPAMGSGTFGTYIYLVDGGTACRLMQNANGGMIWTWGIKTALTEDRNYAHGTIGQEVWYRARMRFPSGHHFPAKGDFNLHQQWHCHSGLLGTGSWNTFIGVKCDYSGGTNPRLYMMLRAGVMGSSGEKVPAVDRIIDPFPAGSLIQGQWYDSLIRIKWYPDSRGSYSWYVNGVLAHENLATPTLLQTASGVNDVVDYQIDNYRGNDVTTESWVDFNLVACGPTRASVGA